MKFLCSFLLLVTAPWGVCQPSGGRGVLHGELIFESWVLWSEARLPAGRYRLAIELKSTSAEVYLRSTQGWTWTFPPHSIVAGSESGHGQVCLNLNNDRWEVGTLNLPEFGLSLLYAPRDGRKNGVTPRSHCVAISADHAGGV